MNSDFIILFIVLLHSLWQLPTLYFALKLLQRNQRNGPTKQRKQLLVIIVFQWIITALSFFINSSANAPNFIFPNFLELPKANFLINVLLQILIVLYFAFIIYKLIRQIAMQFQIESLSSQLETHEANRYSSYVQEWSDSLNFGPEVKLRLSSKFDSVFTFGHFRPIIVMPISIITMLSPAQVESILLHEIAHIKNRDFIANIFLEISEAVFSFNPLMWLVSKEIRVIREQACDEL